MTPTERLLKVLEVEAERWRQDIDQPTLRAVTFTVKFDGRTQIVRAVEFEQRHHRELV